NHGAHVSIDLLVRRWPRRVRIVVGSVVTIVSIALFVQVMTSLVVYGQVMQTQGSATESLGIPYWPAVYVVVVGFAGLVLALVADLARGALSWSTEDPELNVF
ncbi:TRAP transporter small permease, partial [uncultured Aeromicrobium sp.]|uniref:TRAP transporter small permease n=1 Tax=uncultured Aeromicrobium sp. TaxID=337820 RepID=UPI0025EEC6CF